MGPQSHESTCFTGLDKLQGSQTIDGTHAVSVWYSKDQKRLFGKPPQ